MSYDQMQQRQHQILSIARNENGDVVGTSTAYAVMIEHFGFKCYYYRSFVGRKHRAKGIRSFGIAKQLLQISYETLDERYQSGDDPDVMGLYFELRHARAAHIKNQLIWEIGEASFVFVGRTEAGNHCRLAYFNRAQVPKQIA